MKAKFPLQIRPARWKNALRGLPAISIRQPYAWFVVNGYKDVENRSRRIHYRGPILIHASLSEADLTFQDIRWCERRAGCCPPDDFDYPTGGVVGVAEIVDCVRRLGSEWKHPGSWAGCSPTPARFHSAGAKAPLDSFIPICSFSRHPAMHRRPKLVTQYLERIHRSAFDKHPEIIRELVQKRNIEGFSGGWVWVKEL